MKTISKPFLSVICLAIAMFTTSLISAQSKSSDKDFVISVQKDGQDIKLRCIRGCAWTNLEFTTYNKTAQTVNQFGVVANDDSRLQEADAKLADFHFNIATVNKAIVLNGLKGTSWQTLNIRDGIEMINKDGILPKQ